MTREPLNLAAVKPNPRLSPDDVVQIQVEALANNDDLPDDCGICLVYAFASPANRAQTGPLLRFSQMLRNPLYEPLMHSEEAEIGIPQIDGNRARVRVTVYDRFEREASYLWQLSKQGCSPCRGCWMTDAVSRLDDGLIHLDESD